MDCQKLPRFFDGNRTHILHTLDLGLVSSCCVKGKRIEDSTGKYNCKRDGPPPPYLNQGVFHIKLWLETLNLAQQSYLSQVFFQTRLLFNYGICSQLTRGLIYFPILTC